jgi:hypothetical protein
MTLVHTLVIDPLETPIMFEKVHSKMMFGTHVEIRKTSPDLDIGSAILLIDLYQLNLTFPGNQCGCIPLEMQGMFEIFLWILPTTTDKIVSIIEVGRTLLVSMAQAIEVFCVYVAHYRNISVRPSSAVFLVLCAGMSLPKNELDDKGFVDRRYKSIPPLYQQHII